MKTIKSQEVIDLRKSNQSMIQNAIKSIQTVFETKSTNTPKRVFINPDGTIAESHQTYKEFKMDMLNRNFGC